MAVAIARKRLRRRFRVESAGLDGALGFGATRFARKAMRELGLDISRHRARDVSSVEMTFDYVVAMTPYVAESDGDYKSCDIDRVGRGRSIRHGSRELQDLR